MVNATRTILWILGVFLVIVAAYLLFFQTGLNQWIPLSIAGAALLLFIGLMVMSFAEKAPAEGPIEEHGHEPHH